LNHTVTILTSRTTLLTKQQILLDEAMQKVFCCKKMTMFSMNKKLSPHLKAASQLVGDTNGTASSSKRSSSSSSRKKSASKKSSSKAHDSSDEDDDR
jgi:hypothetical protein